jgi:hypothetical protein
MKTGPYRLEIVSLSALSLKAVLSGERMCILTAHVKSFIAIHEEG